MASWTSNWQLAQLIIAKQSVLAKPAKSGEILFDGLSACPPNAASGDGSCHVWRASVSLPEPVSMGTTTSYKTDMKSIKDFALRAF